MPWTGTLMRSQTLKDTFKDAALEVLSGDVADADLAAKGVEIAQGMGSALKGVCHGSGDFEKAGRPSRVCQQKIGTRCSA